MQVLTKADILSKTVLRRERVPVPEWSGEVYVRELTAHERDTWEGTLLQERPAQGGKKKQRTVRETEVVYRGARARLCAMCMCDADGNNLFTLAEAEELGKVSAAGLDRVYDAAMAINGMGEEELEELLGKSDPATTAQPASGAGSQER